MDVQYLMDFFGQTYTQRSQADLLTNPFFFSLIFFFFKKKANEMHHFFKISVLNAPPLNF